MGKVNTTTKIVKACKNGVKIINAVGDVADAANAMQNINGVKIFVDKKKAENINRKNEKHLNDELGTAIYNDIKERFYNDQEINIVVDKCRVDKKDLLLAATGPICAIGPVILGVKLIKILMDKNIDVNEYYYKFENMFVECGLKEKMLNDVNYVPNDEELENLMRTYKRRTNIDLIEILHFKYGQVKVNYKNK